MPSSHSRIMRFGGAALLAWLAVTAAWWALMFAPLPLPEVALARVREICFGAQANGLPDQRGWMMLVLAPLSMLSFLWVAWADDVRHDVRAWWRSRLGRIAMATAIVALGLGLASVGKRIVAAKAVDVAMTTTSDASFPLDYPQLERPAPAFELVNQHGESVDASVFTGAPALVTFAYAHCTTVCPVIVQTARTGWEALRLMGVDARVVVVTLDPWRDTPSSLPGLAESWRLPTAAGVHVLSGPVEAVTTMLADYQVPYERDTKSGEVAHPALVYVTDGAGRIAYAFNNPKPSTLVQAVQRLQVVPQS